MEDKKYSLKIGHLFPDLLNLYGDGGNIASLVKRMEWRGMKAEVCEFEINQEIDFSSLDIVLLGGGSDREQLLVCEKLRQYKKAFKDYAENGGVVLAVCGGFQMLGKFYKLKGQTVDGLEILDMYSEAAEDRFIGNVVLESEVFGKKIKIAGFENHNGRTFTGECEPLGVTVCGKGNNGRDQKEGAVYKNVVGTYLHGPLLPKNPVIADWLIEKALEKKYGEKIKLEALDDTLENNAVEYVVNRFCK